MTKAQVRFTRFPLLLVPILLVGAIAVFFFSTSKKTQVKSASSCGTATTLGLYEPEEFGYFGGEKFKVPAEVQTSLAQVLGSESPTGERWIEVDLSDQKLKAWEGESLFLETSIASGLPWTPTPTGEFRVWGKFKYTKMEGGQGKYYYYLPNVPYVMFFENSETPGFKGYGLHGTYWHNSFGTPRSHGCVNLPTPIAKELFYWTGPNLPEGKGTARASAENPGTRIMIHD